MTTKPCSCASGHRYFEEEAEAYSFKCPVCKKPIVCPVTTEASTVLETASPKLAKQVGLRSPNDSPPGKAKPSKKTAPKASKKT